MTLPSKCPLPGSRLRLSEKTVEARRVLLSDIGFTSMVPELSRSADHLFPPIMKPVQPPTYGQFLRATDLYSPGYTVSTCLIICNNLYFNCPLRMFSKYYQKVKLYIEVTSSFGGYG